MLPSWFQTHNPSSPGSCAVDECWWHESPSICCGFFRDCDRLRHTILDEPSQKRIQKPCLQTKIKARPTWLCCVSSARPVLRGYYLWHMHDRLFFLWKESGTDVRIALTLRSKLKKLARTARRGSPINRLFCRSSLSAVATEIILEKS